MTSARRWLLLVAFVVGCGKSEPAPPDLTQAVQDAKGETGIVAFSKVFPGEWERMFIVPPYTSAPEARRITGTKWYGYLGSGIATRGDITLVVFLNKDKTVAGGGMVKRYALNLNSVYRLGGYSREEAKFQFVDRDTVTLVDASAP